MSLARGRLAPDSIEKTPLSARPQETVLNTVREGSKPGRVFWLMNGLSAVIACYGLFANSPAVVIGPMVVAMLLGPISGVALGLNEGARPLLWGALLSLTGGITWILAAVQIRPAVPTGWHQDRIAPALRRGGRHHAVRGHCRLRSTRQP